MWCCDWCSNNNVDVVGDGFVSMSVSTWFRFCWASGLQRMIPEMPRRQAGPRRMIILCLIERCSIVLYALVLVEAGVGVRVVVCRKRSFPYAWFVWIFELLATHICIRVLLGIVSYYFWCSAGTAISWIRRGTKDASWLGFLTIFLCTSHETKSHALVFGLFRNKYEH